MQAPAIAVSGLPNPSQGFTFSQTELYAFTRVWVVNARIVPQITLLVEHEREIDLTNTPDVVASTAIPETSVTRVQQPDGSYKWYAVHPETKTRVEIDPDQAWFWTPEWQERERQADEDLRLGRYEEFDSFDDFIDSL
jgi:hypothetical protein